LMVPSAEQYKLRPIITSFMVDSLVFVIMDGSAHAQRQDVAGAIMRVCPRKHAHPTHQSQKMTLKDLLQPALRGRLCLTISTRADPKPWPAGVCSGYRRVKMCRQANT
jgi:hypothetical protein